MERLCHVLAQRHLAAIGAGTVGDDLTGLANVIVLIDHRLSASKLVPWFDRRNLFASR